MGRLFIDRLAAFFSERFGAVKKVSLMHDKHTGEFSLSLKQQRARCDAVPSSICVPIRLDGMGMEVRFFCTAV